MPRIITVSTNKGGVLKTTITVNLAGVLAKGGHKVLIVDSDNQGNVALSFGMNPDEFNHTLYDVMVNRMNPKAVIQNVYENIDIIPSNDELTFLEFDVLTKLEHYSDPFSLLRISLGGIYKDYDYILIDTPPNLGLMQGNVLSLAHGVIIPFQPENYSMRSLVKILNAIKQFREDHNPKLKVLGVVVTLMDSRTRLHREVVKEAREYCKRNGLKMFNTVIPRMIRYASSVAYEGLPATLTARNKRLVKPYYELKGEICGE